jgi:hypothetical protein
MALASPSRQMHTPFSFSCGAFSAAIVSIALERSMPTTSHLVPCSSRATSMATQPGPVLTPSSLHDGGDLPRGWLASTTLPDDETLRLDWLCDEILEGVLFEARVAA